MMRRAVGVGVAAALLAVAAIDPREEAFIGGRRSYWAFQPVTRPEVPKAENRWVRTPVDAFLLEAMQAKGLSPSAELGRRELARRVSLDLTGMMPDAKDVEAFVTDRAADAYEKMVDRLLASPAYGERWGLKWLDVVRYADTNGYELDAERPQAWRYRDYVIDSFNADKPYTRFLKEQIAGDELYPGDHAALIATGFLRAGPRHVVGGNQDEEMNRQEVLLEMTLGVSNTFLGLTVGCARCHNHKFDPITQADHYRLQAMFAATELKEIKLATAEEKKAYDEAMMRHMERQKPVDAAIKEIEKPFRELLKAEKKKNLSPEHLAVLDIPKDKRTPAQEILHKEATKQIGLSWDEVVNALPPDLKAKRAALRKQIHEWDLETPEEPKEAFAVANMEKAPPTHVLKIGDHKHKLEEVQPKMLAVLGGLDAPAGPQGRRAALAEWLARDDHPLTARVMVNRIWQLRMGTGLVPTPNDFGMLGGRPTNRKLLDWLAAEFVAGGWSVKKIDRLIVTSSAYRQSAALDEKKAALDGDNRYYWRMNRRRMDGEALRDAMLTASGLLNPKRGGRGVLTPIEPEIYDIIFTEGEPDNLWPLPKDRSEVYRKSIYLLNKRTVRLPLLSNFDQPDAMSSCPVRPVGTHALQALSLFNSDFAMEQARALAERARRACRGKEDVCAVDAATRFALQRAATPAERKLAQSYINSKRLGLADYARALLNRNEFVYIP
jgi:hypothetical protein